MSDGEAQAIKTHKDLDVWKKAINLVKKVYEKVANFPKHEQFGLASQIRRSATSIPSNISPVKLL
jgi:four helix bundle protein